MSDKADNTVNEWHGCYSDSWKDLITPESFSHPAKISRALLARILQHAKDEGWLRPGSIVCDPFFGIGSTGLLGAYEGYQVIGVELEEKFCRMATGFDCAGLDKSEWVRWLGRYDRNKAICPTCQREAGLWYKRDSGIIPFHKAHRYVGNLDLHAAKWKILGCPQPVIIQGDSRRLCEILQPYCAGAQNGADAIVASPPYSGNVKSDYLLSDDGKSRRRDERRPAKQGRGCFRGSETYGQTPGQLGAMKPGDVELILSSPPFLGVGVGGKDNVVGANTQCVSKGRPDNIGKGQKSRGLEYGHSEGQLGNTQGENFWEASLEIVRQCHQILKPGGFAIWVVRAFVRKGQIVDFPGDWRRLCESVGFETLHEHHAMLVTENKSVGLFGQTVIGRTEKKSFFRRLSDSKAARNSYWDSLDDDERTCWLESSGEKAWQWYNSLSDEEKAELIIEGQPDSGLKYKEPTEGSILADAKMYALEADDVDPNDFNAHVRIDYETVYCMQKGERQ